jgi:hypothetical protein
MSGPASFVTSASTVDVNTFEQAQTFSKGIVGCRAFAPFGHPNIAAGDNATPASSTPVQAHWCGVTGLTTAGFVAMRAGSITGLSVNLSTAAAGSNLIVGVYVNGTIANAAAIVTLTSTGSQTKGQATFTHGLYPLVAGDVVDVRFRTGSGWSATTADAAISVEIAS